MTDQSSPHADNAGVRVFPPGVFIAGLAIGYAIQWLWPIPILPADMAVAIRILGALLFVVGVCFIALAMGAFRRAGTSVVPIEPTTALTFEGPYTFTRNPMYLGMALILAGLAGVGNALWPLLMVIPAIAIVQTQVIAKEEAYLERKFGAEYLAFKARVRRWI
jgi:protein-S-isoprenylcysteine O-methyltransferase Ste14